MIIYCSGIGGIGLSAYASLQKMHGHDVSGSDRNRSALTDDLVSQGIAVATDQSGKQIPENCNLFVYSEAIPADAPERVEAKLRGIPQQSYPEALGKLSQGHRVIAVSGTHGKSSTTAIAALLLIEAGFDPMVVVGTKLRELGGRNWRKGKGEIFLLEACEYRKSFHFYDPSIILLTNVDGDHFDFYPDVASYHKSFVEFIDRLPKDGTLITHIGDPDCARVAKASGKHTVDADTYPLVALQTPGLHMRQNAQIVLALADLLHIDSKQAERTVSLYEGSWRRMEEKGSINGSIPVVDDYAHHPREIRATLAALKEKYEAKKIVCVFQPHTHDRTLKLYEDFLGSFSDADQVILSDVYEARKDIETDTVDLAEFARDIADHSRVSVTVGGSLSSIESSLRQSLEQGTVVVCMGAGDITNLAAALVAAR